MQQEKILLIRKRTKKSLKNKNNNVAIQLALLWRVFYVLTFVLLLVFNDEGLLPMTTNEERQLERFAEIYKRPICLLLGLPENNCTNQDASIFLSYLVGHKVLSSRDESGELGAKFLRLVRDIPRSERNLTVLQKVAALHDRSQILKKSFDPLARTDIPFSGLFREHLVKQRKEKLREYFLRLHHSVNRLNASISTISTLLKTPGITKLEFKACTKEIRMSIQSCEFHLKSGVAMALANNVHPNSIWKASHGLYELRASRLHTIFKKVDILLKSRGVPSSLSIVMGKRQDRWSKNWRDIFEAHRINRILDNENTSKGFTRF